MKRNTRLIVRHAAMLDKTAVRIFALTCGFVTLVLLASLALAAAALRSEDPEALRSLSLALCHASFRMAAVGAAFGFVADIAAKRAEH